MLIMEDITYFSIQFLNIGYLLRTWSGLVPFHQEELQGLALVIHVILFIKIVA